MSNDGSQIAAAENVQHVRGASTSSSPRCSPRAARPAFRRGRPARIRLFGELQTLRDGALDRTRCARR